MHNSRLTTLYIHKVISCWLMSDYMLHVNTIQLFCRVAVSYSVNNPAPTHTYQHHGSMTHPYQATLHPNLRRHPPYTRGQVWCPRHSPKLIFTLLVSINLKGNFWFYVREGDSGARWNRVWCHQNVSWDDDS